MEDIGNIDSSSFHRSLGVKNRLENALEETGRERTQTEWCRVFLNLVFITTSLRSFFRTTFLVVLHLPHLPHLPQWNYNIMDMLYTCYTLYIHTLCVYIYIYTHTHTHIIYRKNKNCLPYKSQFLLFEGYTISTRMSQFRQSYRGVFSVKGGKELDWQLEEEVASCFHCFVYFKMGCIMTCSLLMERL